MDKKVEKFNMVIVGTGGQGLITLLQIIAEAALLEGYDIKTSELHGLSQRGGSVEVHIRFGKKVFTPLIAQGKADFILALEAQEALRGVYFSNPRTIYLINNIVIPIPLEKNLTAGEVVALLKKIIKNVDLIPAKDICKEKLGSEVVAGIYLISLAVAKSMIPLKIDSIEKAIKKTMPEKYLELNLKALELAKSN